MSWRSTEAYYGGEGGRGRRTDHIPLAILTSLNPDREAWGISGSKIITIDSFLRLR